MGGCHLGPGLLQLPSCSQETQVQGIHRGTGDIKVLQGIHRGHTGVTGDIQVCFTGEGEVAPGDGLRQHGDPLPLLHKGGLHQEVQ